MLIESLALSPFRIFFHFSFERLLVPSSEEVRRLMTAHHSAQSSLQSRVHQRLPYLAWGTLSRFSWVFLLVCDLVPLCALFSLAGYLDLVFRGCGRTRSIFASLSSAEYPLDHIFWGFLSLTFGLTATNCRPFWASGGHSSVISVDVWI